MFISFHLALCNVNDKRWRSALLQFRLACLTKFTHTGACTHKHSHLFRQEPFLRIPGATAARLLCETFIIYDAFDVVICINFRGILIRLEQLKKKHCERLFSLFKELFWLKEEKKLQCGAWTYNFFSLRKQKKKKVISSFFLFQCLIDRGAQRLFNGPTSDCSTMSNTVSKGKHFH